MPNRKTRQAVKQEQAVWFIKLTPAQAVAFWEVFDGCGLQQTLTREEFLKKSSHVRLRIVENISPIHYTRKTAICEGNLEFFFEDNPSFRILDCGKHPFYTNKMRAEFPKTFGDSKLSPTVLFANSRSRTISHAQWVKKLLALE